MSDVRFELGQDPAPETVFDALREADRTLADFPRGTYPDGLAVETRRRSTVDAGPTYEVTTETTAFVVTWDRYSIYRRGYVTAGAVLLDVETGGLDPDGFDDRRLLVARLPHDEGELQALMLLAERCNLPREATLEAPSTPRTQDGR